MTRTHHLAWIFLSQPLEDLQGRPSSLPFHFPFTCHFADTIICSYDYTKGKLDELVSIIIDSGAKLFVSAVGVPPKHVVDRLHKHGILYMNMIGHPKHVKKCLDVGVDIICAQGGEGGGHTGDVPVSSNSSASCSGHSETYLFYLCPFVSCNVTDHSLSYRPRFSSPQCPRCARKPNLLSQASQSNVSQQEVSSTANHLPQH